MDAMFFGTFYIHITTRRTKKRTRRTSLIVYIKQDEANLSKTQPGTRTKKTCLISRTRRMWCVLPLVFSRGVGWTPGRFLRAEGRSLARVSPSSSAGDRFWFWCSGALLGAPFPTHIRIGLDASLLGPFGSERLASS